MMNMELTSVFIDRPLNALLVCCPSPCPSSMLVFRRCVLYLTLLFPRSEESAPTEWWHTTVQSLAPVPHSSLPPGTRSGLTYTTICLDAPTHLVSLLRQFRDAGGKLVKAQLPTEQGLGGTLTAASELLKGGGGKEGKVGVEVDVWVNATGLSAKWVCGDESMYPIRGQTVLVKGEAKGARTWVDGGRYVIPRPGSGTTILGGTREVGNWFVFLRSFI